MQFTGLSLLNWLFMAWGAITSILVLLMIYRGMIGMHEDDELFLSAGSRNFEAESEEAVRRMDKLRPYIWGASGISAVLAVAAIAVWMTQLLRSY